MGNLSSCGLVHAPSAHVVKVVHANGLVDEFPRPIRVGELIVDYPDHFICRSKDLNIMQQTPILPEDEQLEMGQIYFLLPLKSCQSVLSEMDVKALINKATVARKQRYKGPRCKEPSYLAAKPIQMKQNGSIVQLTVSRDLVVSLLEESHAELQDSLLPKLNNFDTPELQMVYTKHVLARSFRSWRPMLETIEESGVTVGC